MENFKLIRAISGSGRGVGSDLETSDAPTTGVSRMLRDAAANKRSSGIGAATMELADALGHAWVGDGATLSKSGLAWTGADGTRVYRPASFKDYRQVWQANLEERLPGQVSGGPMSNAHIDILDTP